MNDIKELMEIISSIGGSATIDEIATAYAKRYKMPVSLVPKNVIAATLSNHKDNLRLNHATHKWEPKSEASINLLYVSDNRYFATIRDAMSKIFNKSVPLSQGYFSVGANRMAWFPQPQNDKWENTLSTDGQFWHEKPKSPDANYEPDYKQRYIFIHEEQGYRFTGIFKVNGIKEDGTREYELIDDKVKLRTPLVVCRVTYMKFYNGITEDDSPVNGGSYVTENNDAYEKNNFHCYEDGNCYGFVETKYRSGHTGENEYANSITIESINPMCKGLPSIDGVRVIFTAFSPSQKKNVVIGWYDNATVYRNRVVDGDLIYMTKCLCSDAHLIPEEERSFEIPRGQSNDFGIGQSNFWYIQTKSNTYEFEQALVEYIDSIR